MLWFVDMCLLASIKLLGMVNGYYDYHDDRKRLSHKASQYAKVVGIETKLRRSSWDGKYKIPHEFLYYNSGWKLCKDSQDDQRSQCDIRVSIFDVDAKKNRYVRHSYKTSRGSRDIFKAETDSRMH